MKAANVTAWGMGVCLLVVTFAYDDTCRADGADSDRCLSCHGKQDLISRRGKSRFIDPVQFSKSAHAKIGIGCIACHKGITENSPEKRIPHRIGIEPQCEACHERISEEYLKSLHGQISKKICYSCHNPHYSVSFRQMSGEDRKGICLKCHEVTGTHKWLPQKQLHFTYLECTSCHALNAQIGMVFYMVDRNLPSNENVIDYRQLEPFIGKDKPGLRETLDRDGNQTLSAAEVDSFLAGLRENGLSGAALDVRILVLNPSHNFSSRGEQARDCTLCHSKEAKFYSKLLLEVPEKGGGFRTIPVDKQILISRGEKALLGDFYLLGESKIRKEDIDDVMAHIRNIGFKWVDVIGVLVVFLSLAFVSLHGMLMFVTRHLRAQRQSAEKSEPLPVPVMVWHWIHGLCVTFLVLTGAQLRLPDVLPIFATFLNAVNLHNLAGAMVMADYLFWLAFHLFRRDFKDRFLVSPGDFFEDIGAMLHYYGYLIFIGESYPKSRGRHSVFDPMERLSFLAIMLVLIPFQIVTGILMYDVYSMAPIINALGGLRVVDAIHLTSAYLLLASMVVHVYFHTLKVYRRSAD